MPFMYPEELAKLRADHPGLQYDARGNVIGAAPLDPVQMAADAIYQLPGMQPDAWNYGPTRDDYLYSKDFIGPVQPQWWDPNGELMQQGQDWLGGFMAGRDLQLRRAPRPRNPYVLRQRGFAQTQGGLPGIGEAGDPGLAAALRETNGLPIMEQARQMQADGRDLWRGSGETFPNLAYQGM